ncbi:hypothetical protein BHE90_012512 [Fusarium euwallaceae]|uniref:Uncharacterized protein n=2 Tax=Fusarium solani species complex TaxID=232080 RepID=A0A3M2RRP4_9HYPO|nr:hypothetical protein CDV36_012470 [Fusarium kuroshium]RTE73054.1 hypothetical protein BHE90_012512 [Fusarium euwallaceae]
MNSTAPLLPLGLEVPDGLSLESRRLYMAAAFALFGPYTDKMMAAASDEAQRTICLALHKHKKPMVTNAYFEYLVDLTVWDNWSKFHGIGRPLPDFPWLGSKPDPTAIHEGISPVYAQWRKDHVPAAKHEPKPAVSLSSVAASATSTKISPPLPPPVPSLAARQYVWRETYGDFLGQEPICGPFEVHIPHQRPDEDHLFAGAQEFIPHQLAISWETDGPTHKLILGLAEDANHRHLFTQSLLTASWADAMQWAHLVHSGEAITLASYLEVRAQSATMVCSHKDNGRM